MVHVFVQKSDGKCYWFSYDTDRGSEEEWTKMGSYMICTGHQMSGYFSMNLVQTIYKILSM